MFLNNPTPDYHPMFNAPPHTIAPSQDALHASANFARMTLNSDQALEKLASNVRAATTTSASDRAKQIFVQAWYAFAYQPLPLVSPRLNRLTANYAPYPDGNVPRQGLYFSYRRVCDQYGIPHINTATLGKAIRLCFPTIKTRRLGVRGNSKYHCTSFLTFGSHR
jgi:regulatory factor X, other